MTKYPKSLKDIPYSTYRHHMLKGKAKWPHVAADGRRTHELYKTWEQMKQRCYNSNTPKWHLYGGKGIRVCSRWYVSFWDFVRDMGPRPAGYSLDRIDSNQNYTPDNCRWASADVQANNIDRKYTGSLVDWREYKSHHRNLPIEARISINYQVYRKHFKTKTEARIWLNRIIKEKIG